MDLHPLITAYYTTISQRTRRFHMWDLLLFFSTFLRTQEADIPPAPVPQEFVERHVLYAGALFRYMSVESLRAFAQWMETQSYPTTTQDRALRTLSIYTGIAGDAGWLPSESASSIRQWLSMHLRMIRSKPAGEKRVGKRRVQRAVLSHEEAMRLLDQPDTPVGHRDAVLMALLLCYGLYVDQIIALQVGAVQWETGAITVLETLRMPHPEFQNRVVTIWGRYYDTLLAVYAREHPDEPHDQIAPTYPVIVGSRNRHLMQSMSLRAITKRVDILGTAAAITPPPSAIDCRMFWLRHSHGGDQ